jgi:hypothetical protein
MSSGSEQGSQGPLKRKAAGAEDPAQGLAVITALSPDGFKAAYTTYCKARGAPPAITETNRIHLGPIWPAE